MNISNYGKLFLRTFNEKNSSNVTAEEFFWDEMYPVFFEGDKHLMYVLNSPFSNYANKNKTKEEKIRLFKKKIENQEFDASMFIGGFAGWKTNNKGKLLNTELIQVTSFGLSGDYSHKIDSNEIYLSWIGVGLIVQFGRILFLFENGEILYKIYEGWKLYRELLNEEIYLKFKGNQIQIWNSLWLDYSYSPRKKDDFNPFEGNEDNSLKEPYWVKFILKLSKIYPNTTQNAYVFKFNFDKANETYGTMPIKLKSISGIMKFYSEYFCENNYVESQETFEKILGTAYSVQTICEMGSLGILALKPELLRLEEMSFKSKTNINKINKYYKEIKKNNNFINIYKTYIMVNLNYKNIESDVENIAKTLIHFEKVSRKNNKKVVEELLNARTSGIFTEKMTEIRSVMSEENKDGQFTESLEVMKNFRKMALNEFQSKLKEFMTFVKLIYVENQ